MTVESMARHAMTTTDFRFLVGNDPDHVVLEFDTPQQQTEVYLTKGQLERLVYEADTAIGKLKCRERLPERTR
jgi:hypothetical protein